MITVIKSMYEKMKMNVKNCSQLFSSQQSSHDANARPPAPLFGTDDLDANPSDTDTFFTSFSGVFQGESL